MNSLPTELIHQILTNLEPIDIVRSFRCICRRFNQIVKNYNRFRLNFKSIDKDHFHFLCNFIRANQIETLILSDDDETPGQIEYFLTNFRLEKFTQLNSLTLIDIDDCNLNKFLKDLAKIRIKNLVVQGKNDLFNTFNINKEYLTSIFAQPSLKKVDFRIQHFHLQTIDWPKICAIEYLTIQCSTIGEYISLLLFLPKLRCLTIETLNSDDDIESTKKQLEGLVSTCNLTSLTFKNGRITMPMLALLLSLTPTIEHLQLIQTVPLLNFVAHLDGWENFVTSNLPLLTKFEFFLVHSMNFDTFDNQISFEPSRLIERFRTPFWLETKNWLITCDHIVSPNTIFLYTNSLIGQDYLYSYVSKHIRRYISTPDAKPNNRVIMEDVRKLSLEIGAVMASAASSQSGFPTEQIFPNVETLVIMLPATWSSMSIRYLHGLINLSRVKKLHFRWITAEHSTFLKILIKDMTNLQSIQIDSFAFYYQQTIDDLLSFCSSLDTRIKHLTLPIRCASDMFTLQPSIRNRSSVKFQFDDYEIPSSVVHLSWLSHEKDYYLCRLSQSSLCLWLDKISKQ